MDLLDGGGKVVGGEEVVMSVCLFEVPEYK
jgi:hypothetical protein